MIVIKRKPVKVPVSVYLSLSWRKLVSMKLPAPLDKLKRKG